MKATAVDIPDGFLYVDVMSTRHPKKSPSVTLNDLRKAVAALHTAQRRVDDAIAMLRSPDVDGYCIASWSEIAEALGMTKQGAQQRYNRKGLEDIIGPSDL